MRFSTTYTPTGRCKCSGPFLFPGTFYFADAAPKDWTSPENDALWQDVVKTLFDPCPEGWRVPKGGDEASGKNPWCAFSIDNGPVQGNGPTVGHLFGNPVVRPAGAWYPLCGRRNFNSGNLTALGGSGYCYTSTALSGRAYYFGLYGSYINPWAGSGLNGRAEDFPVRCIRE